MAVPRITREELKARLDAPDSSSHPLLIDVRLKYPYEHSTVKLPGAMRILPEEIPSATLPQGRDVVLYDSDPGDMVAAQAAAELIRRGWRAAVLQGGIAEWLNAKLATESKPAPQPSPPAKAEPAAKPAAAAAAKPAAPAKPPVPANPAAQQEATAAAARPDDSSPGEPTK
jgi:rhodanese-related sulfurtransferase